MAKGFNARGMKGMGGGMNMNMIRQAQKMQADMQKMQSQLEDKIYTAQAGGGAVKVTANGKHQLTSLTILPDAVDPQDVEMLQDMVILAVNDVLRQVDEDANQTVSKLTGISQYSKESHALFHFGHAFRPSTSHRAARVPEQWQATC